VTAGELGALLTHIGFQIGNQRSALRLPDSLSVVKALAIDRALDCEQGVDATHDLDRNRREGDLLLASSLTSRVFLKIRHGEERTPGMDPTGRLPDRPRTSLGLVEFGVSAEGVGLQDAAIVGQMRLRMLAPAIARVIEHCRRRI
jgi:hypothetical protein